MTIEPSYQASAGELRGVYDLVGVVKYRNFKGKDEVDEILAGNL